RAAPANGKNGSQRNRALCSTRSERPPSEGADGLQWLRQFRWTAAKEAPGRLAGQSEFLGNHWLPDCCQSKDSARHARKETPGHARQADCASRRVLCLTKCRRGEPT